MRRTPLTVCLLIFSLLSFVSVNAQTGGGGSQNTYSFRPTATPPTPTCPYVRLFYNTSNQYCSVDCAGVVTCLGGGGGGGAPINATYVVMSLDATLTNERRLVAGTNITIVDGGANGDVTINGGPTVGPGNPDTSVQFNNAGTFAGDTSFTFTAASDRVNLGVAGSITGKLRFLNSANANTLTLQAGTTGANIDIFLPPSLPSSGNECLQISDTGAITRTGSACGAGGGGGLTGSGIVPQVAYFSGVSTLDSSAGIVFNTDAQATITAARIVTEFQDINGNSWIKVGVVGSAVNQITITNNATGSGPTISATGSDSNVPLNLDAKGTSLVRFLQGSQSVPVTLTDAATIATDASLSNRFEVTLGGNRTLANPTNPTDNQQVVWTFIQDGTGGRTVAFDTQFGFGAEITTCTISPTAGKRSFMSAIYNSAATKWFVVACVTGY